MMKHYGMTEVKEHQTMASLWKELAKGDRVAIYLMGNRKGGSKGVHWTSSAHFVCSVDYKVRDGKRYVYVKDSNSTSSLRNGFISYEDNMRGDVSRVWSGKLPTTAPATTAPKKLTNREKIAKCAENFAYTTNSSKARYPNGAPKAAYKKALYKVYPNLKKLSSPAAKGASCDVFVGVCVRSAGIDKDFPRGLSPSYLAKSKKFKRISKSNVKKGDIIVTPKHICIAWTDGKVKEASNGDFWPKTTKALKSRLSASGAKVYRAK